MTSLSSNLGAVRAHLQRAAATAQSAKDGFESLQSLAGKGEGAMERVRSAANSAYSDTSEIDSSAYGRSAKAALVDAGRSASGADTALDQTGHSGEQAREALRQALQAVNGADGDVATLRSKIDLAMGNQSSALASTQSVTSALIRAESGLSQAEHYADQVASDSDGRDVSNAADSLGSNATTASIAFSDAGTQAGYGHTYQAYAGSDIALALREVDRLDPPSRSLLALLDPTQVPFESLLISPNHGAEAWNQLS